MPLKDTTAEAICRAILECEQDFHMTSEEVHDQIHESAFKRVRRLLPVTGAKFDWERLHLIQ